MMFVQWRFDRAGAADLLPVRGLLWGADAGGTVGGLGVIHGLPGGADTGHTGIIGSVTASGVVSIEGNIGAGNDANGGQVQRQFDCEGRAAGTRHGRRQRRGYLQKAG